jgi:MFS family permease
MRFLVAVAVTLGGVIGALEVAAPTIATAHGTRAASGLLIAALSVGGIVGAIVYAARRWSIAPRWRLVILQAALTLATAAMIPVGSLVLLAVLMLIGGLALNPSLTTLSVLVDEHVPRASAAEAFGWLSLGFATGTGAANAVTGALTSPSQPSAAFVIAAIIAAAGTVVAIATRRVPAASGSLVSNPRVGGSGPDGGAVATHEL